MLPEDIRIFGNVAAPGGSDSSAQVLRNSRLEFRLLALAWRYSLQKLFRGRSEVPAETFASLIPPASPAPPIYEVMGDHGSPPGPLAAS